MEGLEETIPCQFCEPHWCEILPVFLLALPQMLHSDDYVFSMDQKQGYCLAFQLVEEVFRQMGRYAFETNVRCGICSTKRINA